MSWRRQAETGSAVAQYNAVLRRKLETGRGFLWCRKAAENGYAPAQNRLGYDYSAGRGVKGDNAAATYWYRKAAEQGNAAAQFNLGAAYGWGRV